ncbi:GNAT family N-acetyltransferase [Longispora albida]|uniref:GNAT family N-acetyltransferase n=1 Tax=Longispora albida TaxID=203523 RepID=UPI0003704F05|nr:GNAT family N-acetyltransferase [Longispora albida]
MTDVLLREVRDEDLETFFEYEADPEASRRARFPSREREVFLHHWRTRILGDPAVGARTVLADGEVAGNIVAWEDDGRWWVGYWYGRKFWGRGIGTKALQQYLAEFSVRPLYADPVVTNTGSVKLLERCGFTETEGANDGQALYVLS